MLQHLRMASTDLLLKLRQLLLDLLFGAAHRTTPTRDATTRRPNTSPPADTASRQTDRPYPQLSGPRRAIRCSGRNYADQPCASVILAPTDHTGMRFCRRRYISYAHT
jgi:hypothetical protein